MGKDFIPLGANHISKKKAIKELYHKNLVMFASKTEYFHVLPDPKEIAEIELGDRPMVGHTALDRGIGVRVPVSQH